ncbi:hypothetical protein FOXB_07963 [Fusarium oxysporum f. sp. conglutinans Fo5176]|uniref:Uncharacterized protein n=1 Tax=Fusarium oxysporum (strain Fo5176) TaxID=660025 RepID=F9FNI3_FUSOF|nr:hypothetical protein FOXB_07963 [Fusarium oxysporum f. sp. conglutinans Fo5176]
MHLLDAITKSAVEKSIMDSPDFSALSVPWFPSDLGESVCFNGAPIHSNCNVKDNFVCGNVSGYVSGFSNFTTWIGLILEVIWARNSTSAYGDERLRKELGDDLRFGYTTTASESRFPGRARINLVAVPEGSKPRCRIRLDFETEFG